MTAVAVKKVKPYPIPLTVATTTGPIAGQILRLELRGVVIDTAGKMLKVAVEHNVSFVIPVSDYAVTAVCKVIKIHDRVREGKVERMAELHFIGLSEEAKTNIRAFLRAIHQLDE